MGKAFSKYKNVPKYITELRGQGTLVVLLLLFFHTYASKEDTAILIQQSQFKTFFKISKSSLIKQSNQKAWKQYVPKIKRVMIPSTADKMLQPALFYNSVSDHKKPLLVALHSWSENYYQHYSIPYGMWAVANDWVMIHPDYRGAFTNADATGSESAVQDVLDAVAYAKSNADIDTSRIYITGFSGGGMMTLIMVGRYPEMWAGAVAWVPVYDLVDWYRTTKNATHDYSTHIINSCGGTPTSGTKAENECKKRSVSSYLKNAKGSGLQVYIATGIRDLFVPPGHSLMAFNDLANENDRISIVDIEFINNHLALPTHLAGNFSDPLFSDAEMKLLYEKRSADVVLKIYDGNHDVIYNAGLYWLSKQRKKSRVACDK